MTRTKLGEVAWTDLQSHDLEGQSAFYEALLGWTHTDVPTMPGMPDYRMFYKDGKMVAGGNVVSAEQREQGWPSFWAVYLATPELDATVERAISLGAQVIMPAMDVMDSGRMVAIADPTGGSVFFWQAKNHPGAETFMTPGSIAWADLATRDPEAAARFFTELLGWKIDKMDDPMPYWQFSVDGEGEGGIMGMPEMMGPEARPFWTIYFAAENLTQSLERAAQLGGTVVTSPVAIGEGMSFAVLTDPAGGTFALLGPQ